MSSGDSRTSTAQSVPSERSTAGSRAKPGVSTGSIEMVHMPPAAAARALPSRALSSAESIDEADEATRSTASSSQSPEPAPPLVTATAAGSSSKRMLGARLSVTRVSRSDSGNKENVLQALDPLPGAVELCEPLLGEPSPRNRNRSPEVVLDSARVHRTSSSSSSVSPTEATARRSRGSGYRLLDRSVPPPSLPMLQLSARASVGVRAEAPIASTQQGNGAPYDAAGTGASAVGTVEGQESWVAVQRPRLPVRDQGCQTESEGRHSRTSVQGSCTPSRIPVPKVSPGWPTMACSCSEPLLSLPCWGIELA